MPRAAYSYPQFTHNSAGSGVSHLRPSPPVSADGVYFYPPAPYPYVYPPSHPTPVSPYGSPYLEPRLHHNGVLPQSITHGPYPHLHYCPGAPYCSSTADGVPNFPVVLPDNGGGHNGYGDEGLAVYGKPPLGPIYYPQMSAIPSWSSLEPDERLASQTAVGEHGSVPVPPSYSLVPFHDDAKPTNSFDGAPQWRGLPVMWKGGAPFALVPLSSIEGEKDLFMPKRVPTLSASEQIHRNANSYVDRPLLGRNPLPISWKQTSIPATSHKDGKAKPNTQDSPTDEVCSSKPLSVMWDGRSPLVLMPSTDDSGKESLSILPFGMAPAGKEVGPRKLSCAALADKEREQGSGKSTKDSLGTASSISQKGSRELEKEKAPTLNMDVPIKVVPVVTASSMSEKGSRELEKEKAPTPNMDVPIKVIPVVQLSNATPMHNEISVEKELPSAKSSRSVADDVGVDHVHAKLQKVQQAGKEAEKAGPNVQQILQLDVKGTPMETPAPKKGFPPIKLVPGADAKRCKSPRKTFTTQKKHAVHDCQSVGPVENGYVGAAPSLKITPLYKERSVQNCPVDVTQTSFVEGILPKEAGQVSDVKINPVASAGHFNSLCSKETHGVPFAGNTNSFQDKAARQCANEVEKPDKTMMSQESAAKRIQAMYRGYCIRKTQPLIQLKIIKEVQSNMPTILGQLGRRVELLEPMERKKFSESIMALLLKLDTVQGWLPFVREQRKSVAKELSRVLETLDNIELENAVLPITQSAFTSESAIDGELGNSSSDLKGRTTMDGNARAIASTAGLSKEAGVDLEFNERDSVLCDLLNEKNVVVMEGGESQRSGTALQVESMDNKAEVDQGTLVVLDTKGDNEKFRVSWDDLARNEKIIACLEEIAKVDQELPVALDTNGDSEKALVLGDDPARNESSASGMGAGVSDFTQQVLQVDEIVEGEKETLVALDLSGNLSMLRDSNDSVREQSMHDANGREEAEFVEYPSLKKVSGPQHEEVDVEEDVLRSCESVPASCMDGNVTKCIMPDAVRYEKIGRQVEAGECLPAAKVTRGVEEQAEGEREDLESEDPKSAVQSTGSMQSCQLIQSIGESCADTKKVLDEIPTSVKEIGNVRLDEQSELIIKCHDLVDSVQFDTSPLQADDGLCPNGQLNDKFDVALARQGKLADTQQLEGDNNNPSIDVAHADSMEDSAMLSTCELELLSEGRGYSNLEQPFCNEFVVGEIEDGKTIANGPDSVPIDLANLLPSDEGAGHGDAVVEKVVAQVDPCTNEGDHGHEDGSVLIAPSQKCTPENKDVYRPPFQECAEVMSTNLDEIIISNDKPIEAKVTEEESQKFADLIDVCAPNPQPTEGGTGNAFDFDSNNSHLNGMGPFEDQLSTKYAEVDIQKPCFSNVVDENKNLLAVVEQLMQWNQQQATLIMQLNERMSRLEEAQNSKHPVRTRRGRIGRRHKVICNNL